MVITKTPKLRRSHKQNCRAILITELVIAMAILTIAVIPIGYSLIRDARWLRSNYHHAVAMEIVDGEMEILAAGEWRSFPEGTQLYRVRALAATNLPPGQFTFTRSGNHIRLAWKSAQSEGFAAIVREVTVK